MKKLILALAASAALTAPAFAADLPEAVAPIAPDVAAYSWTGFYLGKHTGYADVDDEDDSIILFDTQLDGAFGDTVRTATNPDVFSPGFCDGRAFGPRPENGCDDDDEEGYDLGVRLGYDYQFGSFVIGALVEGATLDIEDSVTGFTTTPTFYTMTRELDYTIAGRVRAGFAVDRFLGYVTGGVVYGDFENKFFTGNTANTFTISDDEDEEYGYQIGGGVEAFVSQNFTVGLEYMYTNFDESDFTVRAGPLTIAGVTTGAPFTNVNPNGTDFAFEDEEFDYHSFRVTAGYKFSGLFGN